MGRGKSPRWHVGTCPQCNRPNQTVGPLHGEQGGPPFCLSCGMEWHGKHGRKRKLGRVVTKALKLFFAAGGGLRDLDKIKLRALGINLDLGHLFGAPDTIGQDVGDITSELLRDTLRLTHPDIHPPERHELATRVTRELRALEPYVFPAPKPEPRTPPKESPATPAPATVDHDPPSTKPAYPCELCEDTYSRYYCTVCRAELDRRREAKRERRREKQRAWYRARTERKRELRRIYHNLPQCATCDTAFEPKRTDAKYCSPACRQRAHRQRDVTAI